MTWANDLRYALRLIRQHPWFSATIMITIALGIGVNTTVFTLVNAVLFKPLPFPGGDRMVMIGANRPSQGQDFMSLPHLDIDDIRQSARALERVEAFAGFGAVITEAANTPERYRAARITTGLFQMLEVQPVIGRTFNEADGKAGAERVILLSYTVWKDRYNLDPGIINRGVRLNEEPAVIIGVMPNGFHFPNNERLWTPAVPEATLQRTQRPYMIVSRLKPGAGLSQAQTDLNVIATRLATQFPETHKDHGLTVRTFHQAMNGGPIRLIFLLMLGAVGFVLLIACANVANLLLGRLLGRSRELALRAALGASRWRILRQLLFESVTLSVAGGLVGLFFAQFGIAAFSKAVANVGKPYWIDFSMDWLVFVYFAAVCVTAGILFGIMPALRASKVDLNETLKEGARDSGSKQAGRLAFGLVVLQYALAAVLLSGAGLFIRSFLNASEEYSFIPSKQILAARVALPSPRYAKPEDRRQFLERLTPRLTAIPGVSAAALVSNPPASGSARWRVQVPGEKIATGQLRPEASVVVAQPGYLGVIALPIVSGRDFTSVDGEPGKGAVIVNREFATRFFKDEDPIGKRLLFHEDPSRNAVPKEWMTIIGVVKDVRQSGGPGRSEMLEPVAFVPYRAESWSGMTILLRFADGSAGIPAGMATALRREVQQLDQDMPLLEVMTLQDFFNQSQWYLRVFGTLFSVFAAIAMGMAAIGIYAVVAAAVGRRTREIGVRLALGADRPAILHLVMRRGLWQIGVGLVVGLAAAFGVCRLMATVLYRVSPTDPVTFGVVGTILAVAGIAACWLPARRASGLDPVLALRQE